MKTERQRGVAAVADGAYHETPARLPEDEGQGRERQAQEKQDIHLQGVAHLWNTAPSTYIDSREPRRHGLDVGLAQEKGQPGPENHERDPGGDVVDARAAADPGVQAAQRHPGPTGGQDPEPGEPER